MEEILDFILDEQELLAGLSFRYIHCIDVNGDPAGPRGAQGCEKVGRVSACFSHSLADDQAVSEERCAGQKVGPPFPSPRSPPSCKVDGFFCSLTGEKEKAEYC